MKIQISTNNFDLYITMKPSKKSCASLDTLFKGIYNFEIIDK